MSDLTEVLKLFKYDPATDGDMTFNIGQCMNDNWDKIDTAILLAIAAAGAYNPEESYAVGDYCTYKGKLRKCSTAIPTGETWTEAHWTTTTVAAELAELSSQLSNLNTLVGGATTPQGALANLGAGVRPNLFINYDFRIWQRYPSGTYTGAPNNIYIADGFLFQSSNGGISNTFERVNGGGIKNASGPDCRIRKRLEGADSLNGKVCTMSALKSTGFFTETVTITGASETADIIEQFTDDALLWLHPGETMHAIKLEQGSTQTLAYQDDTGAWQLLPQPESDYATQLAKCQRYQLELISKNDPQYACVGNGSGRTSGISGIECPIFISTPITLRTRPVVTFNGNFYLQSGDSSLQVTRMAIDRIATNGVNILVYAENIEIGKFYSLYAAVSENHSLLLDANL